MISREEHRMQAMKKVKHVQKKDKEEIKTDEERHELPPSIAVLFSAHQFLGKTLHNSVSLISNKYVLRIPLLPCTLNLAGSKGWCITGQGELLHFILDNILDRLDTPIFEKLRDKIDIHIEQAFFCLYQHPSKKNKVFNFNCFI